ncbi:MAG: hypothetical protein MSP55_03090, partial [Fusobacterium necrophorum]|nr:hypothetical protein [Fusobacterium necrophorum]
EDYNDGFFNNHWTAIKTDANAKLVAEELNKTNKQVNTNTKDITQLKVDFSDFAKKSGDNKFTGNNTFEGKNQNSTFTVEVKGKATDPKDKNKMIEDQESTVKHTLTAVGSYTRANGKKKIHNAIMKGENLESMDEKDQIVFHTLDDTGSHLAARGAKKEGNDKVTINTKIFDDQNKEIASQTFHYDGIYVKAMQDKKIHNSIDKGIQFELNKNGSYTTGKKENNIVNKVEESVETRLDKEGSKVEVEKEKKIVNKVKDGAELVMNKDASKFTKDLYVGNLVWRDRNKNQNGGNQDELVIGDKENKASGKSSGAIGFENGVVGDESFAVGIKNIASGVGAPKKVLLFGIENRSIGNISAAFGIHNIVKGDYSSSFGIGNESTQWGSSAFGVYNKAEEKESSAFGRDNLAISLRSSAFGINNVTRGIESSSFGIGNETMEWGSSAFGIRNIAAGEASSAFGFYNRVNGYESSTFGRKNAVDSKNSTAVGNSLFVSGENSGSFGNGIMKEPELIPTSLAHPIPYNIYLYKNEGKNSYTIGNYNTIAKGTENNFILGNKVKIEEGINNSVVLGNESTARKATKEEKGIVGNIEFGGFAGQGKPENGVVSVGAEGKERQIINVAAGKVAEDSTDAINGSQLFSVAQKLTDTGLNFQGNDEQEVQKKLGQTLTLKGEGVSKEQSAKFKGASGNINVKKSKEDGSLEL